MRGFLISPYSFSSTPVESRKFNYPQANTSINVAFPEELLIAAREEKETFSRQVMIYPLGHLYQEGKISAGIGAQVLGCDRYTFYTLEAKNIRQAIANFAQQIQSRSFLLGIFGTNHWQRTIFSAKF